MYGFHRSTEPRGKVEPGAAMIEHFTHAYFVKGRDDLLVNIHRKTSSNFAKGVKRERGATKVGVGAGKELKHLQQALVEQEERSGRLEQDVDVLKKNQMQLANTIQALHAQNVSLQNEIELNIGRLDALIKTLAMHNVEVDGVAGWERDRSRTDEALVMQQQHQQAQQAHQMQVQHMQHQAATQPTAVDAASQQRHMGASMAPYHGGMPELGGIVRGSFGGSASGMQSSSSVYDIEDDAMDILGDNQSVDLDNILRGIETGGGEMRVNTVLGGY